MIRDETWPLPQVTSVPRMIGKGPVEMSASLDVVIGARHSRPAGSRIPTATQFLFVVLSLLGLGLRIGYGVARYRGQLNVSGNAFVSFWDNDALQHVLIAKALLTGKGYVVDDAQLTNGKRADYAGQEALFKAPLYEFFLACCFAISGFSFKLFFPLQALLGGLTAGLAGLITWQTLERRDAAWLAGAAVAVHPVLVNSASQPYNEDIFFFLFAVSICSFLVWLRSLHLSWALLCGATIGLCMLTRENGLLLLVSMGAIVLVFLRHRLRAWVGYGAIVLATCTIVAPWTIRNYARFGVFVPVASIMGEDLNEGNNECVAKENIFAPYWAEGRCAAVDEQRQALAQTVTFDPRTPAAVRRDRISRRIALEFIWAHPASYARLVFRRLWTTLLPFNPRGNQRLHERIVLLIYWLGLYPAGLAGSFLAARRLDPRRALLLLVAVLNLLSMAAVLYWSDLRFRIAVDLPLACFAGFAYSELFCRTAGRQDRLLAEPTRI
jgi:hypothetical protein